MNLTIIDPLIRQALEEDLPWGDITTENVIPVDLTTRATMLLKEHGVIAGLPLAERVFHLVDPSIKWTTIVKDGTKAERGTIIAEIEGNTRSLLMAERVALNFIQRMSGIATLTNRYVEKVSTVSSTVRVTDTRKTTPGLRYVEKYSVRMGGGINHRYCLSDAVMIKDNHLAIMTQGGASVPEAISDLRRKLPHTVTIEMEVDRINQIPPALDAGVDIILLDNMTPAQLREAVELIDGKAKTEASGGVDLNTVAAIAATGVEVISVGALTHSAPSLDIGLDFPE